MHTGKECYTGKGREGEKWRKELRGKRVKRGKREEIRKICERESKNPIEQDLERRKKQLRYSRRGKRSIGGGGDRKPGSEKKRGGRGGGGGRISPPSVLL